VTWLGYSSILGEMHNVYITVVTNLMDRQLGKPSIHVIMLKVNCNEIRCANVDWIHLAQDSSVTTVMNYIFYIYGRKITDCQILKKDSAVL
jgi:hypothetical protein